MTFSTGPRHVHNFGTYRRPDPGTRRPSPVRVYWSHISGPANRSCSGDAFASGLFRGAGTKGLRDIGLQPLEVGLFSAVLSSVVSITLIFVLY